MFRQGLLTGEFAAIHPAATATTTAAFNAATGGYTTIVKVDDPSINLQIDPETRSPRSEEYSIGLDREVGRKLAVAIAYVGKKGSNFVGWTDVGGQYREERGACQTAAACRSSCSPMPRLLAVSC
jgi:hypothetical protein